jgi:lipoprotein-releasing system ATP-binding protein
MIKLKKIKKKFGHPVELELFSDISFEVKKGEIIAIMGSSGSGKSTLLNIIGSLEKPTSGTIFLDDQDINTIPISTYRQKNVGFIFQSFHLLEDYTPLENLLLPCWIAREKVKKGSPAFERAVELLSKVDLLERKDFPVNLLSGGEKQRIGIARALMNNPSFILADEPTGNLDSKNGKIVSQLLLKCCREYNKSVILVTHDPILAGLCDRRLILQDGSLL